MLKQAFNALLARHSKVMQVKRLGDPNIFSPVRATPSNYFRFLEGPSGTVIPGHEFILPVDTMTGQPNVAFVFDLEPTDGEFSIAFKVDGGSTVGPLVIAFDAVAADIQTAVQGLTGCENAVVTGTVAAGLNILFVGAQTITEFAIDLDDLVTATESTITETRVPWDTLIKRGDKLFDSAIHLTAKEIIEMFDMGGQVMGYRIRCE